MMPVGDEVLKDLKRVSSPVDEAGGKDERKTQSIESPDFH